MPYNLVKKANVFIDEMKSLGDDEANDDDELDENDFECKINEDKQVSVLKGGLTLNSVFSNSQLNGRGTHWGVGCISPPYERLLLLTSYFKVRKRFLSVLS